MKIFREGWQWANEQMVSIQGFFSGFVTIGGYGKWLKGINIVLILICPTAALVRRDLAKVCTVPVLLVNTTLYAVNAGVDKVVIS